MRDLARLSLRSALAAPLLLATLLVPGSASAATTAACVVPAITSVTPPSGPLTGGTVVTVRGTGLGAVTSVRFGSTPASAVTAVSDAELRATAPARSTPGNADVSVITPCGATAPAASSAFTYVAPPVPTDAPTITKLDPQLVYTVGNDLVFIEGTNIRDATAVLVDGESIPVTDEGDGTISFFAPAHEIGIAQVQVVTPRGTSSVEGTANDLRYIAPCAVAQVSSISPSSGPVTGGTVITIKGFNLVEPQFVLFDNAIATEVVVVSNQEIRVTAPPASSPGTVEVGVGTLFCGLTNNGPNTVFTYTAAPPARPVITKITPPSGRAGIGGFAVISGSDLAGAKAVRFGTKPATRFFFAGSSIIAIAPPQPRGGYAVTVTGAGGTSVATTASRYFYL